MNENKNRGVKLQSCWPYFVVSDLAVNLAFFKDKLGFECSYEEPAIHFAIVGRDNVSVLLRGTTHDPSQLVNGNFQRDSWPKGYGLYDISIQVSDVDALYAELVERGATPKPLLQTDYGRDTSVKLPDGYCLVFLQLGAHP